MLLVGGLAVDLTIVRTGGCNGASRNQTLVVMLCKGGRAPFASCNTGEFAPLVFCFIVSRTILNSSRSVNELVFVLNQFLALRDILNLFLQ